MKKLQILENIFKLGIFSLKKRKEKKKKHFLIQEKYNRYNQDKTNAKEHISVIVCNGFHF